MQTYLIGAAIVVLVAIISFIVGYNTGKKGSRAQDEAFFSQLKDFMKDRQ